MSSSERPRRTVLLAAVCLPLAGCGFQLRQAPQLPFRSIALTGFAPRSLLAADLRRQLEQRVTVLERPAEAQVVLQSMLDARERSVVAQTSSAQVRELQLRLRFHFRALTPGGRELMPKVELLLARDMSYSETNALAKEIEEAELFAEMQVDIALQVMRRLASLRV
jgi:LPS-assembly lipoprotein